MILDLLQEFGQHPERLPILLFAYIGGILLAFTLHELSHAVVATLLGDPTASRLGRITLNPLAHLDPLGTILILFAGFGWAKPVPFNPNNLRFGPRIGTALVAVAGPAMNLFLAILFALPFRLGIIGARGGIALSFFDPESILLFICSVNLSLNVLLAVFNLLPIAPLDGFKIAVGLAPRDLGNTLLRYEQYGMVVLFGLFAAGYLFGVNILGRTISPVIEGTTRILVGT